MKNKTFNIVIIAALLILWGYFISVFSDMPDKIPMNIGAKGNVTSWGSKNNLIWFMLIPVVIFLSYKIYEHVIKRLELEQKNPYDQRIILFLITIFFAYVAFLYVEMIRSMDGMEVDSDFFLKGIMLGFGVLMIGIGNYLPRIEQNRTLGIRMPWTLKNEEVWDRTHRLAGKTALVSGILMVLVTYFDVQYYYVWAIALMVIGLAIIPTVYAYKLYHTLEK